MTALGSLLFFIGAVYAIWVRGWFGEKAESMTDKELFGWMLSGTGVCFMYVGLVIKIWEILP
jgi:hypothetical protein